MSSEPPIILSFRGVRIHPEIQIACNLKSRFSEKGRSLKQILGRARVVTERGAVSRKDKGNRVIIFSDPGLWRDKGGEMEHLPQLGEVFGGEMAREHVARELQNHLAAAAASLEF
jgi:hypothetical protein